MLKKRQLLDLSLFAQVDGLKVAFSKHKQERGKRTAGPLHEADPGPGVIAGHAGACHLGAAAVSTGRSGWGPLGCGRANGWSPANCSVRPSPLTAVLTVGPAPRVGGCMHTDGALTQERLAERKGRAVNRAR